ncbi:MAG: LacI family DNA-binding transcriptional regulator [Victivallales bacterium]
MATLKEIAGITGLSISVVSRALNPQPDKNAIVSSKTKALVQKTASRLSFRPNLAARSLKKGISPSIGVFLPEFSNNLIADLVMGMAEAAEKAGFPLGFHFGLTQESYYDFFKKAASESKSGIITYPYILSEDKRLTKELLDYHNAGGSVVVLNTEANLHGITRLGIDDRYGGGLAAKHLLERACTEFICFSPSDKERFESFSATIQEAGYKVKAAKDDADAETLLRLCAKRKTCKTRLGVFATTDRNAMGLLPKLRSLGFTFAENIFLIGYDDLQLTDLTDPPLTTIHQPFREEGRRAIKKLLRMLDGEQEESETLLPELIVRKST